MDIKGFFRETCPDCGATVSKKHERRCDVARCLKTGLQRNSCTAHHRCGADRWDGYWPGWQDCLIFDLTTDTGFPDLNRLYAEATWDPSSRRWRIPER